MLQVKSYGTGPTPVIMLHDWFCDSRSYSIMVNYLDPTKYTIIMPDLRGYGASQRIEANYTLAEICGDVIEIAKHYKWEKFHLVGHSMTGMAALYFATHHGQYLSSVTAITPSLPRGGQASAEAVEFMTQAARSDDEKAKQIVNMLTGSRYHEYFVRGKVVLWRSSAHADARVNYCHMFNESNFAAELQAARPAAPLLVISGHYDAEGHQAKLYKEHILPHFQCAAISVIGDAGHYPMAETPILLAGLLDGWWKQY